MSWQCPRCQNELGDLNGSCEYCKIDNITVYNPDRYYIRDIRIYHITVEAQPTMTPQEELFAELFNHEKKLICDMDTLTLRAHREELAKIAFEARARLTAVDDEDEDRKKKKNKDDKPKGFERSLNTDEYATNAINTIKERQKRLTKQEKIQAGLEKLGISSTDAAKLMSAGTILGRLKDKDKKDNDDNGNSGTPAAVPVFNPFEKKE